MIRFQKKNGTVDDVVCISHNHALYNITMKHYKRLLSYKNMISYVNTLLEDACSDGDTCIQYNIPGFPSILVDRDDYADDEYETFCQALKFWLTTL